MEEFFKQTFQIGDSQLTLGNVLLFILALLLSWLITRIASKLLFIALKKRHEDSGKMYAITRIAKYIMYVAFFMLSLQLLNVKVGGLLLGASALLIGVGIGLQQIFYDLFSGFILLFERKVQVGDFVDMDGMVGRVDRIDMRTSVVRSQNNISVIVPNSMLVSDKIINWSHNRGLARFAVPVGVAYGSDVELVRKVLIDCATEQSKILNKPAPVVQYTSFGESALNFKLLFWSRHFKEIETIKSDLHFSIDKAFRAQNIVIAYRQLDVHLKREYL